MSHRGLFRPLMFLPSSESLGTFYPSSQNGRKQIRVTRCHRRSGKRKTPKQELCTSPRKLQGGTQSWAISPPLQMCNNQRQDRPARTPYDTIVLTKIVLTSGLFGGIFAMQSSRNNIRSLLVIAMLVITAGDSTVAEDWPRYGT